MQFSAQFGLMGASKVKNEVSLCVRERKFSHLLDKFKNVAKKIETWAGLNLPKSKLYK